MRTLLLFVLFSFFFWTGSGQSECYTMGFHGGWTFSPCPAPPPKGAEAIAARTRALLAAFKQEEAAKATAFYKEVVLPHVEAHLTALPAMLAAGALEPDLASTVLVDWPANGTKTMRREVCTLLKAEGFECSEAINAALDLFIAW
jgi:hypothetical protein